MATKQTFDRLQLIDSQCVDQPGALQLIDSWWAYTSVDTVDCQWRTRHINRNPIIEPLDDGCTTRADCIRAHSNRLSRTVWNSVNTHAHAQRRYKRNTVVTSYRQRKVFYQPQNPTEANEMEFGSEYVAESYGSESLWKCYLTSIGTNGSYGGDSETEVKWTF